MSITHPRFLIVGCTTPDPAAMPLDPDGSLRKLSGAAAEDRLQTALDRQTDQGNNYVKVSRPGVDEDGKPEQMASVHAVQNSNEWTCGTEAAKTIVNTIGVPRVTAIIQASAAERHDMLDYLAEAHAPATPAPVRPQWDMNTSQDQAPTARSRRKMTPELHR